MEEIHQFFAVTASGSLYLVTDDEDPKTHAPLVEKIALMGNSKWPVGTRLRNGNLVGINERIQLFITDKHNHTANYVSTSYWGGHSAPIISLFLNKEKARECLASPNLQPWDPRWKIETNEVLWAIGSEHLVFRPEEELLSGI